MSISVLIKAELWKNEKSSLAVGLPLSLKVNCFFRYPSICPPPRGTAFSVLMSIAGLWSPYWRIFLLSSAGAGLEAKDCVNYNFRHKAVFNFCSAGPALLQVETVFPESCINHSSLAVILISKHNTLLVTGCGPPKYFAPGFQSSCHSVPKIIGKIPVSDHVIAVGSDLQDHLHPGVLDHKH